MYKLRSGFCMAESWARRLSLCLACKPFPGLCACTRTGWWCASVVATRSLSLFTDRADRCSQISSLDYWCATRFSKTFGVVHRYALSERLDRRNRPKKTGETVDRRQNNGSVKAVSPRHCPATCAPRNCSFSCCAGQSLRQCPLHRCWRTTWTTRSKRRPTCSAQLHLPTHDLFWAKVRWWWWSVA